MNRIAVRLPSHIDLDDLQSTGVIGLMDAIDKYDPGKNCKFKTYAEFRIKGAILDQLRSLDWVPRSVRQRSRKLESAYGQLEQELGRAATEEEVADSMGLEMDKFHTLVNQVRGISMINLEEIRSTNSDGDSAGTFADVIEDTSSENPFDSMKLLESKNVHLGYHRLDARKGAPGGLSVLLRGPQHEGNRQHPRDHREPRLPDPHEGRTSPQRQVEGHGRLLRRKPGSGPVWTAKQSQTRQTLEETHPLSFPAPGQAPARPR